MSIISVQRAHSLTTLPAVHPIPASPALQAAQDAFTTLYGGSFVATRTPGRYLLAPHPSLGVPATSRMYYALQDGAMTLAAVEIEAGR